MPRHKRFGNSRRLQAGLGQTEDDAARLRAAVGTHRSGNSSRYRAKAERKNNERDKDFEQRKAPLAVTPGGAIGSLH
jgi:hypothetical protein